MENKNTCLKVLVILLSVLVIVLSGYIVYDKVLSKDNNEITNVDNNNISNNTNNENVLIDSVKITNFAFGKPYAGGFGGGDINTLVIDINMNLNCSNEKIIGIQLSGYCLDSDNNKYEMSGPVGVAAFYCDNHSSYNERKYMNVSKVFDSTGSEIDRANIKWEEIEIKYCKIDKVKFMSNNYDILATEKELNYEKEFN